MSEVSAPWLHATLADAAESLAAALEKLEAHTDEETASELLRRDLVEVYAKLNYAVNTAYLGSEALNVLTEDELVAMARRNALCHARRARRRRRRRRAKSA